MNFKKLNAQLAWRDKTLDDLAKFVKHGVPYVRAKCHDETWTVREVVSISRWLGIKPGAILAIFFDQYCEEYEANKR